MDARRLSETSPLNYLPAAPLKHGQLPTRESERARERESERARENESHLPAGLRHAGEGGQAHQGVLGLQWLGVPKGQEGRVIGQTGQLYAVGLAAEACDGQRWAVVGSGSGGTQGAGRSL